MILSQPEQSLESVLPKAQDGIRPGRTEEWKNMWTTILFLDKRRQPAGLPLCIITLDLSKAFDAIHWKGLWEALRRQKNSNEFIWSRQCGAPSKAKKTPTGQVRSGLHASGEPVLGRRRKKHNMYTTAIYMRQKFTN